MAITLADWTVCDCQSFKVTHKSHLLPQGPAEEEGVAIGFSEAHVGGCGGERLGSESQRPSERVENSKRVEKRQWRINGLLGKNDVRQQWREVVEVLQVRKRECAGKSQAKSG